jgi:hypothetical protein
LSSVSQISSLGATPPMHIAPNVPPEQICPPGLQTPIIIVIGSVPHVRDSPSTHGQPSSATPEQSLSTPSQSKGGPSPSVGPTPPFASLQSSPQRNVLSSCTLQHALLPAPSASASTNPNVARLQSSSWPVPSHTSTLPGYVAPSVSSQSSPPHTSAPCPSPSPSTHSASHVEASSPQTSPSAHGPPVAATHPRESASVAPGMQRSIPLQKTVSSQSSSTTHGVPPPSPGAPSPATSPSSVPASEPASTPGVAPESSPPHAASPIPASTTIQRCASMSPPRRRIRLGTSARSAFGRSGFVNRTG